MAHTGTNQSYFLEEDLANETTEKIGGVSHEFVVGCLAEGWPEFRELAEKAKIKSIKLEEITPARPHVMRYCVTFSTDKTMCAIIKMPSLTLLAATKQLLESDDMKEQGKQVKETVKKAYNCEAEFYRQFSLHSSIPGFPTPRIYYINKWSDEKAEVEGIEEIEQQIPPPPMLILEDVKDVAADVDFGQFDISQVLSQLKSVVVHLAMFHKHLLCMENDEEWKTGFEKLPMFINSDFCSTQLKLLAGKEMGSFNKSIKELQCRLSNNDFLEKADAKFIAGLPMVLVLMDSYPQNVMFSRVDPSRVHAFIDFQPVFVGSIAYNLARMASADAWKLMGKVPVEVAATLKEAEMSIFSLYYRTLRDAMGAAGRDLEAEFGITEEKLLGAFRLCKVINAVHLLQSFAAVMDSPIASKTGLSDEQKAFFERQNKIYAERAKDACEEALQILATDEDEDGGVAALDT